MILRKPLFRKNYHFFRCCFAMKIPECCEEGGLQSAGFSKGRTGQGQLEGLGAGGREGGLGAGGRVEGLGAGGRVGGLGAGGREGGLGAGGREAEGVTGLAMEEIQGETRGFRYNNYKITLTLLFPKCYRLISR